MLELILFTMIWLSLGVIGLGIHCWKFAIECFIEGDGWEKLLGLLSLYGWAIIVAIPFCAG
jgi:hypothetical protein